MSLNIDFSNVSNKNKNTNDGTTGLNLSLESVTDDPKTDENDDGDTGKKLDLNLNLESIAQLQEREEEFKQFNISDSVIDNLVAAIGVGLAAESVINARILDEESITEARAVLRTVVRGGKLVQKRVCPEGFQSKGGLCTRMTAKDAIAYKKRAKKAAKTRLRKKPTAASKRSKMRSMLVRGRNQGKVNRVVPA